MLYGLIALLVAQLLGNTLVPVGTKIAAPLTGEIVFMFFRFLITTLVLYLILIFTRTNIFRNNNYKQYSLLGFMVGTNIFLFTFGIHYTTIIMSSLIYAITPILVGVAGHFFLRESLSLRKIIGLVISMAGLLILITRSVDGLNDKAYGQPVGNILIIIAMVSYAYYIFYSRKVLKIENASAIHTTFWTFIFVTLYMLIIFSFSFMTSSIEFAGINSIGIWGFIIVGFSSALQYYLLHVGVKHTTAFISSIFQYIGPLIAASVSMPLLGEQITPFLVIGGALILAGLFLSTSNNKPK